MSGLFVAGPPTARWLVRGCVAALIIRQLPAIYRTASDPSQSDFSNYFVPAYVLAHGGSLASLYSRDGFAAALFESGLSGLGSFIPHPPANALWLLPLTSAGLSPTNAKLVWTALLIASIVLSVLVVRRLVPSLGTSFAALIVLAPTLAIRNGLAFGQPYLLLSLMLLGGVLALQSRRSALGGFLLGLGVSFKPYALILGFLFIHRDRRRSLGGFVFGALFPSLALLMVTGGEPFRVFVEQVLPWMLRGEIQDPFAVGWGSVAALANRLWRFEPDLNPSPWMDLPMLARFAGASSSTALLIMGGAVGRAAFDRSGPLAGVGVAMAFAMAASPFGASYHFVLLVVSVSAVMARLEGPTAALVLVIWATVGSSLPGLFRDASGPLMPLAFARLFLTIGLAVIITWPWLSRHLLRVPLWGGLLAGVISLPWSFDREVWPRVPSSHRYAAMKPHFCGPALLWWSPSDDGRRLESHGESAQCSSRAGAPSNPERGSDSPVLSSRFVDGSWNVFLRSEPAQMDTRVTYSDANEFDPVLTPDGCAVVFASDQDRGLGSTALYRIDVSSLIAQCAKAEPRASPPEFR